MSHRKRPSNSQKRRTTTNRQPAQPNRPAAHRTSGAVSAPKPASKTSRGILIATVAVVVVAIVVSVIWLTRPTNPGDPSTTPTTNPTSTETTTTPTAPTSAPTSSVAPPETASGLITQVTVTADTIDFGRSDAPVTLDLFLEYMCPGCGAFERSYSAELRNLVDDGTIRLRLHILNFLDRFSQGTRYSTRATNAMVEVARSAPAQAFAFHSALYDHQPAENTPGLSDDEIKAIASGVGVPDEVSARFSSLANEQWVTASNEAGITGMTNLNSNSTPTIGINGVAWDGNGSVIDAIKNAANG